MVERTLTEEEKSEFARRAAQTRQTLGIADEDELKPKEIVQLVENFVDNWQKEHRNTFKNFLRKKSGPDTVDLALGLGAVWGDQMVRHFDWDWVCIRENEHDMYGVCSPDRAMTIFPTYFVKACLDDVNADCTAMLAFNMLNTGKISGLPAYGYENLMKGVHRIVPKS